MKTTLTQQNVTSHAAPEMRNGKHVQEFLWDSKVRGFGVGISDSGGRTFVLQTRIDGKVKRIKIGKLPEWTVVQARERAESLRRDIAHQDDPIAAKKARKDIPTFGELATKYFEYAEAEPLKSAALTRTRIETACKDWMGRKADTIARGQVASLKNRIAKSRGRIIANRLLAHISAVFGYCIDIELFKGVNPALKKPKKSGGIGIERFPENERKRYLTDAELQRLGRALADEPDWRVRAYIMLLLATGARKGELRAARWEHQGKHCAGHINLTDGIWIKHDTKTGVEQHLMLSARAVAILGGLPSKGKSEFVFPGVGKSGHLHEPFRSWTRIRKAAKIEDVHLHDLRHTFASQLVQANVSLYVVGKLLNHKNPKTTERYSHLNTDAQRAALTKLPDLPMIETAIETSSRAV